MAVLSTVPVNEKPECKPQRQDYARGVFPGERTVGLVQAAAREQDATAHVRKTVSAKWQRRCPPEYLLGTREEGLRLFLVREIRSPLH